MNITRRPPLFFLPIVFMMAAIVQAATFWILPFLAPIILGIVVAVVGVMAFGMSVFEFAKSRHQAEFASVVLVIVISISWLFGPTKEFGTYIKFKLNEPMYVQATKQLDQGQSPECFANKKCWISASGTNYLVFPWDGFTSAWTGVVYSPSGEIERFLQNVEKTGIAGAASCDTKPIGEKFFVCSFY